MTKRIISLVLVCILAIPILAVPASATTTDHVTSTQFDMFVTSLGNLLNDIEDNIIYYLYEISVATYDVVDAIEIGINNLIVDTNTILTEIDTTLDYYMQRLWASISSLASDIGTYIQTQTTTIVNKISSAVSTICQPLNQIVQYVQQLWSGNQGLDPDIDNIGEELADDDEEYADYRDIIQEATRPEYEDIDLSLEGIQGNTIWGFDDITPYSNGLRYIVENTFIYDFLFFAFVFAAISFVVFGKR